MNSFISKIVIVGGGTAGWMAAAGLSRFLSSQQTNIILVESADIGTIGVGEATLPGLRDFNDALGIDEIDFIKKTQATFKLGIEFNDWHTLGSQFFHPFANYGMPIQGLDFYHIWQSLHKQGQATELGHYCLPTELARQNKFAQPNPNIQSPLAQYHYAYHFDASLYAKYLRNYSEAVGVQRIESTVQAVNCHDNGFIKNIVLSDGSTIEGDLFIDCSGLKGLLIEETLKTGYEDWSHWLPVNSAVAVQSNGTLPLTSYTKTTALDAGWQWRIPLQHRVGNGYVYCDRFIDDQVATETLLNKLDGEAITTPRVIKYTTGRRKKFWHKNCVALGLASGFLEPLESTSISLIQTGLSKLTMFFPINEFNPSEINEANRAAEIEMERIRDFLMLHYVLSNRDDTAFWQHIKTLELPDSLQHKIAVFKRRGHIIKHEAESFGDASWQSIYSGFKVLPQDENLKIKFLNRDQLAKQLEAIKTQIANAASATKDHNIFIQNNGLSGAF